MVGEHIHLKSSGRSRISTAGTPVEAETSNSNIITIGDLVLDSQTIEIISIQHLSEILNIQIDGIIGYELLKQYVVTTDLDQRKFLIQDPDGFSPGNKSIVMQKIDLDHHHFGVPVKIHFQKNSDPVTLIFKVDTAFPDHLVFYNSIVQQHNLADAKRHKVRIGVGADTTLTRNLKGK